jgi:hypothetical protein
VRSTNTVPSNALAPVIVNWPRPSPSALSATSISSPVSTHSPAERDVNQNGSIIL